MQPFSPTLKRKATPIALTLLTVGAMLLVSFWSPGAIMGQSHPTGSGPLAAPSAASHAAPISSRAGQLVASAARPASIVGPIGGKVYQTTVTTPPGNVSDNLVAADPNTGVLYSLNAFADTVVSIEISSGAALHNYSMGFHAPNTIFPTAIAVNHTLNRVYVAVQSTIPPNGWLLVLDATSLTLVANVSTFGSAINFQPAYLTYDPYSKQLLIENGSNAVVAMFNTSTNTVTSVLTPTCAPSCVSVGGMVPVPRHQYVVLPTDTSTFPTINTSVDSVTTGFTGNPAFSAGVAAYSPTADYVWVANTSFGGHDLQVWNGAGTYVGSVKGPTYVSAMAYDAVNARILVASLNYTVTGYSDEIWDYDSLFGVLLAHYHNPSAPAFIGYSSIAMVQYGTVDEFVTGGVYNATTQVFTLSVATPYLAYGWTISSFNVVQYTPFVDSANGIFYVNALAPFQYQAYSESAPSTMLWAIPSQGYTGAPLAIDPLQGRLYVASPTNNSILTYNATSGSWLATTAIGFGTAELFDDPAHALLWVGTSSGVSIYSTVSAGITFVASVNLPGVFFCAATVDPVREVLYVASCPGGAGNVTEISGRNHIVVHVFPAGAFPESLAVGGTGLLYVGNAASQNISVDNPATNATVGAISTPGFGAMGLVANPSGDWLYATNLSKPVLEVIDGLNRTVDGSLALPSAVLGAALDPTTGTVIASTVFSGTTFLASLVAAPSAPTGLALARGNDSLTASWNAVVPPGGLPVQNYTVYTSTNASGPWTLAKTTTSTTATLSGLTDGTTYYAVVRATSAAGTGPISAPVHGTPAGVPYPPTSVVVAANGSTGLKVAWAAPASTDGAAITNYTVFYSASTGGAWSVASAGTGMSWSISGLKSGTSYSVKVIAFNSVGGSNPSATVTASTASVSTNSSPLGGSLLWIAIAVVILAVVIAAVLLLMRRRKGPPKPWSPPPSSTPSSPPSTSMPPWGESPPPSGGGPPPGAMGPPPGAT